MSEERLNFQSDVARLLEIVAHSLYSEKEVFLRELISNASDACDKLRYAAQTQSDLVTDGHTFEIRLLVDRSKQTLTVADNGIGMNRDELVENLGTIARSGTARFLEGLTGDARKDVSVIGQFGVGFYSAFMVATEVEVVTRRADEAEGWRWRSDGKSGFTIAEAGPVARGTTVILHLKQGEDAFLEDNRVAEIVRRYSDHIAIPVRLGEGTDARILNKASALWMRPRSAIKPEEYTEFYRHISHAIDDPWATIHWRAEGKIEYNALIFIPGSRPFDLFDPHRHTNLKLYVRRVFVSDQVEELLSPYLRFLRGVVDSEDLPLNISREMLQNNPVLARIRQGLTRRILQEITRKAEDKDSNYEVFWKNFGAVLKEGLYDDQDHRKDILALCRFNSTSSTDSLISLSSYVERMREGQEAIYYITGNDPEALLKSPHLEGFRSRGIEVLLLTDQVDEFWVGAVQTYADKPLRSITRGGVDLSRIKPTTDKSSSQTPSPPACEGLDQVIALFKTTLGENVKDVRVSDRLTDSAVCLIADEGELDLNLERLLKQHRQLNSQSRRILEINPSHPLIHRLADLSSSHSGRPELSDAVLLLFDQARIVEGDTLPDTSAFAKRLSGFIERAMLP